LSYPVGVGQWARTIPEGHFKAGQDLSPDAIHSHLSQHFAKWQLPEVIFTDAIKRTSVGKGTRSGCALSMSASI
jgi:acyl-CoA synthetase (AMP-forming)/AMP-acid ligase II